MSRTLAAALLLAAPAIADERPAVKPTKSALEIDDKGWIDLVTKKLEGWKRLTPGGADAEGRSPWGLTPEGTITYRGAAERLTWDERVTNGVLHVEWKFAKPKDKKDPAPAGAVLVRADEKAGTYQAAPLDLESLGTLTVSAFGSGDRVKEFKIEAPAGKYVKDAGEWNALELTCVGKKVTLWVNGRAGAADEDAKSERGFLALEGRGTPVEFRNVKWKAFE